MIEENATVVGFDGDLVIIEASRTSACGQCQASSSCGQKSLSEWAASKMTNIEIVNPLNFSVGVGDQVVVGIDEGGFIKASALIYMLPLFLMIVFGGFVQYINGTELYIISMSFIGLSLGFVLVRFFGKRLEKRQVYRPVLLRVS